MAKKNNSETTEKKAESLIKVKKNLGFVDGKRSFFEGGKNILLIEGETITDEDFELFTEDAQRALFDM